MPADATEAAAHREMLALLDDAVDPFSRENFTPGHFTVGAFAVSEDHVVLVHHRRLKMWIEPGGHIDPSDPTLPAAAVRELEEETGIVAGEPVGGIFDIDVHDIPAAAGEPPHKHYNVSYRFECDGGELAQVEEVVEARWVAFGDVRDLSEDPAVLRAIDKLSS